MTLLNFEHSKNASTARTMRLNDFFSRLQHLKVCYNIDEEIILAHIAWTRRVVTLIESEVNPDLHRVNYVNLNYI